MVNRLCFCMFLMVWLSHNFDDLRHLSNLSSTISGGPATGNPSFHGLGKLQFWLGTLTNCWGWDLMFLLGFIPLKVGKTMPCLPRTGNGNHTTFRNGDDWGMVYGCLWHCFTHINKDYDHFGVGTLKSIEIHWIH